jgi:hypothetical protein
VTSVVHVGGASSVQVRTDMEIELFTSIVRFYQRHSSRMELAEIIAIVKALMLARLVRDGLRLGITRDTPRRAALAADMAAWRHVLLARWHR